MSVLISRRKFNNRSMRDVIAFCKVRKSRLQILRISILLRKISKLLLKISILIKRFLSKIMLLRHLKLDKALIFHRRQRIQI